MSGAPTAYAQTVQAPHRHQCRRREKFYKWNLLFTVGMLLFDIITLIINICNGNNFAVICSIIINAFLLYTAISRKTSCLRFVESASGLFCFFAIINLILLLVSKFFFKDYAAEMLKNCAKLSVEFQLGVVNELEHTSTFINALLTYVISATTLTIRAELARKVMDEQSAQNLKM